MFKVTGILVATLLAGTLAHARFLPEDLVVSSKMSQGPSNINEEQFNTLIQKIQTVYAPIVKTFGASLSISGSWNSQTLNAGATQIFGYWWKVAITGAIARRPELTPDGFSLIVCHEVGHHLGGFSFAKPPMPLSGTWGANEGQADYFATHACARKLWAGDLELNATYADQVTPFMKAQCDHAWAQTADRNLCYRVTHAVRSVGDTMAGILRKAAPKFETPDNFVVAYTFDGHPNIQCRTDTSFQGALCAVPFDETIIPGKSVKGGRFGLEAEKEAALHSCTALTQQTVGLRPVCWYGPHM